MSLKAIIEDLNTVPALLREFYAEQDGKYILAVEGLVPKARLDEFRANNIALAQERDAMRQQYDGIDPQKARELLAKAQKEHDRKLIDAGKVDDLLAQRVEAMRLDYETQLQGETQKNHDLSSQLENLLIDGAIKDAATRAGVRPTAVEDVLLRGRGLFRLVDGKAMPMKGDDVVYGKSGEAMTMDEWLHNLAPSAPHLFSPSRGGGATGGAPGVRPEGKSIESGDIDGFINNLSEIARHNIRVG